MYPFWNTWCWLVVQLLFVSISILRFKIIYFNPVFKRGRMLRKEQKWCQPQKVVQMKKQTLWKSETTFIKMDYNNRTLQSWLCFAFSLSYTHVYEGGVPLRCFFEAWGIFFFSYLVMDLSSLFYGHPFYSLYPNSDKILIEE